MKIYSVQKGDTIETLAKKHGISRSDLRKLNTGLPEQGPLTPGLKVKIPTESKPVRLKPVQVNKRAEKPKEIHVETASSEEPEVDISLNSNTYTFKTENVQAPTMPHNDGYVTQYEETPDGIPMMEDHFPNAMKHKEQEGEETNNPGYVPQNMGGYTHPQSGYTHPQSGYTQPHGGYSGYPTPPYHYPYQSQMPNGYPTTGNTYPQAGVPSQNENPQQSFPSQSQYEGYPPQEYYGGYGATPTWPPYRNPLGCQAEDPYYSQERHNQYASPNTVEYGEYDPDPYQVPYEWNMPQENTYPSTAQQGPVSYNPYTQKNENDPSAVQNQGSDGYQNGPYSPYPPYYQEGQYGNQPINYPGSYPPQQPYYSNASQGPSAPDYSMWESYVDYHEPPFQPDFPVGPETKRSSDV